MSAPPSLVRHDAAVSPGVVVGGPARGPQAVPRLGWWSRTWRYLVAGGMAFVLWALTAVDYLDQSAGRGEAVELTLGGAALLDGLVGLLALALLPLRRRRPLLTACLTVGLSCVSASAFGAAILAALSMATHRRWRSVVVTGTFWAATTAVHEGLYRSALPLSEDVGSGWMLAGAAFAIVVYAACVATGFYVGARRELITTLRERAETAEREQQLRAEAAQEAERTRIAREMHDVLAHRISLVAMQAGALAYREDLPPAEVRETAETIRANAHRALGELRDVLGVLRAGAPVVEPPQPTLAELPALLAEERAAGSSIVLDVESLPGAVLPRPDEVPEALGRTVFRIVQEGLTNARKHAPGGAVVVRLAGGLGSGLDLTVRSGAGSEPGEAPSSGMGLAGLAERAELAGGRLHAGHDGEDFVVTAWLPWPDPTEGRAW